MFFILCRFWWCILQSYLESSQRTVYEFLVTTSFYSINFWTCFMFDIRRELAKILQEAVFIQLNIQHSTVFILWMYEIPIFFGNVSEGLCNSTSLSLDMISQQQSPSISIDSVKILFFLRFLLIVQFLEKPKWLVFLKKMI